jgi:hypothetical protein
MSARIASMVSSRTLSGSRGRVEAGAAALALGAAEALARGSPGADGGGEESAAWLFP